MSEDTHTPARLWVGGKWTESGQIRESLNPSTAAVVGTFYDAGEAQARAAVDAAADAFTSTGWARAHTLRATALERLADTLQARVPEPRRHPVTGERQAAPGNTVEGQYGRYLAALRGRHRRVQNAGRAAEVAPGQYFQSTPEPAGVVGIISPWNSPVILTARALGPALAAGCTVVIKLPGQTALTNTLFAEVIASVEEIPAGVVNVLTETGSQVARHLVASERVNVISYTGSTPVGRQIAEAGGATLKRMGLEVQRLLSSSPAPT